jgi:hypothetical protein
VKYAYRLYSISITPLRKKTRKRRECIAILFYGAVSLVRNLHLHILHKNTWKPFDLHAIPKASKLIHLKMWKLKTNFTFRKERRNFIQGLTNLKEHDE